MSFVFKLHYKRIATALTIVRITNASICPSRTRQTNAVTFDGLPGGCLNEGSPFGINQYSSSHSVGSERSKLGTPLVSEQCERLQEGSAHSSS